MNVIQIQNTLKNVPDETLVKYVQNPTTQVPQYLALAELQRRKTMRTQAQGARADVGAPVASEAVSGIAGAVPSDMYSDQSFAGGGIVAFAEGDLVKLGADWVLGRDSSVVLDKLRREKATKGANTSRLSLNPFVTVDELGRDWKELPQGGAALEGGWNNATPTLNRAVKPAGAPQVATPQQPVVAVPTPAPQPRRQGLDTLNPKQVQISRSATPAASAPAPTANSGGIQIPIDTSTYDQLIKPEVTPEEEAARLRALMGTNEGLVEMKERMQSLEQGAQKQADRAPWMALANAGLAMAAGQAPNALTNIAAGGIEGLKAYTADVNRLNAMEEKRFALANQIAQAERDEQVKVAKFGVDSEQAKRAERNTAVLKKQEYLNNVAAENAKIAFDERKLAATIQMAREQNATQRQVAGMRMSMGGGGAGGMSKAQIQQQTALLKSMLAAKDNELKNGFLSKADRQRIQAEKADIEAQMQALIQEDGGVDGVVATPAPKVDPLRAQVKVLR
jgi:hypothetical protein